jgi:hypothetical protein
MMFYGREKELNLLEEKYLSSKSELVVIYGRRRIGKSALINKFAENKKTLKFEGIEGEQSQYQIQNVSEQLIAKTKDPFAGGTLFDRWEIVFSYLTEKIVINKRRKKKLILFFDEIQWMAAGRSKLISIMKYYWDNFWKDNHVMLILCGSIASFMVKKVIRSKALYGRVTLEILLQSLSPSESGLFFANKRSKEEILKYLMILGGVPKYLEEIDLNKSFNQNINRLCFENNSYLVNEISKIFYSQFKEAKTYLQIINVLKNNLFSFQEIANRIGKSSGGGLKYYLEQLENAEFITSYISFDRGWNTKFKKYRLSDEYLVFYFKYIEPNLKIIKQSPQTKLFEMLTSKSFTPWMEFAFERFCLKNAYELSNAMGFGSEVLVASPYFQKADERFQIDLIYQRTDQVITLCEIKYHTKTIDKQIIPQVERKVSLLPLPQGYTIEKALISLYGPSDALKQTRYFNHFVTIDDIF